MWEGKSEKFEQLQTVGQIFDPVTKLTGHVDVLSLLCFK